MTDNEDAPFVEKPKRNPNRWKKNGKGDNFTHKAKKNWKHRERELHEESLDDEAKDYR